MKIAQVVCTFPPYKGGIGNVAFHYSLELSKIGHEIVVFIPHYKKSEHQFLNFKLKSFVPWLSYGNAAFLPQLFWSLRDFDIIHLHYPFFGSALPIYFLKKKYPEKKLVLTYHMDVVGGGLLGKYFSWHTKKLMPKIIRIADKVIVTSLDYAKNSNIAEEIKKDQKKFVEIPLGANLSIFHKQKKDDALVKKYQLKTGEKIILFVAALDAAHYFKGLNYLLEAMSKIKTPAKLVIVGRGSMHDCYIAQVKRLGLADRVLFAGYVSDFDLARYYNFANVFVLPSVDKSEAFGLVYVEAMACATPVIASNLAGVRTVVDDGLTGFLVEPRNVSDLADKIDRILSNDSLAQKMGEAGAEKVKEKYTWPEIAKQIDRVYREVVS
ncbi:MAG: glycosyltransferase family 4 protein [Patescibacteria group bacterium]